MTSRKFDARTDLVLERVVDVPPDLVWRAWTEPHLLMQWYTPRPWRTVECEIDLQPGGLFRTVMQSPEGEKFTYVACYLDVVKHQRLIWTFLLGPGYRPVPWDSQVPVFTAALELMPEGHGTRYTATAMHLDEAGRATHDRMGFQDGWGKAAEQLVECVKAL